MRSGYEYRNYTDTIEKALKKYYLWGGGELILAQFGYSS